MTLAAGTNFEFRTGATAGMLNGGGFNPGATFGITDATTDANTANTASPIVSSATYNFVAADVNAWLFVKAGTNWIPGFYQIVSVASNKATLNATIGQAVVLGVNPGRYDTPSTVVGCATVGTPTSGTIGIDYSQQNAADATAADYASVGASTTLTSATAGFRLTHIGNFFHLTTTGVGGFGLVGWYEIATYTSTTQVTTDRTTNNGTALVGGTGYVGGALDLTGTLADSLFEAAVAGNTIFFKNGAFTLGAAVSVTSSSATGTSKIFMVGYNAVRGDNPATANQPAISCGANIFLGGGNWSEWNINWTGTGTTVLSINTNNMLANSKVTNTSATTTRNALNVAAVAGCFVVNNEMVSQNGNAFSCSSNVCGIHGNYMHDSTVGFSANTILAICTFNIIETCTTAWLNVATDIRSFMLNNTIYGTEAKAGTGVATTGATGTNFYMYNNIFYGLTVGMTVGTVQQDSIVGNYNDFFNNTTDRTRLAQGLNSIALNPTFTGASQITFATATVSGSVLTQSGADFSAVTDNVDYCRIVSGTISTPGVYLITAHTSTTLTLNNAPGNSATTDKVGYVGVGHNFAIGTNLKGTAFPGAFLNSETTGYLDIGAVQRQESAAAATTAFTFVG